jgi:hypothetical protein
MLRFERQAGWFLIGAFVIMSLVLYGCKAASTTTGVSTTTGSTATTTTSATTSVASTTITSTFTFSTTVPTTISTMTSRTSTSSATGTSVTTAAATATTTTSPGGFVTISLTAQNMSFDKSSISVPSGASVTVNFNNKDTGVPHNFAVYQTLAGGQTKAIYVGDTITGQRTITYKFVAPAGPGNYFFECDVHPLQMNGTFVIQ